MVGALSVVGSTVMESHTGPCLCLDALPTTNMNLKSGGGDLVLQRNSIKSKHMARSTRLVELSSCFSRHDWRVSSRVSSRKHRRDRRLVVVSELGGQYEDTFEDVKLVRSLELSHDYWMLYNLCKFFIDLVICLRKHDLFYLSWSFVITRCFY